MSTPTGKSNDQQGQKSVINAKAFSSPPSTFALGLVALAVVVGLLLVAVVNSDKPASDKTASSKNSSSATNNSTETKTTVVSTTTTTPISGTKDPAEVTVVVLNGSSIAGVATSVTNEIEKVDYKVLTAGNDSSKDKNTIIYYKSGFEKDAKQLATNVVPGILNTLQISQDISTKQFPSSAPIAWDQQNLVAANIVIVVGDAS